MWKIKLGKLAVSYGDECEMQTCNYFSHYLRYGSADMSHAGYHRAEEDCLVWQKRAIDYLNNDRDVPGYIERMCQKLEQEVKA